MSNFEDNPFGEPIVDNPFEDPAVQNATRTAPKTNVLQDYDPFQENNQVKSQSTTVNIPQATIPSYNNPSNQTSAYGTTPQISTEELQRQKEELDRREQELKRLEDQLRNSASSVRRNNFPPLPEKFCFKPCFYHDIDVEIRTEFQPVVRRLHYLWMLYALTLFSNAIVAFCLMFYLDYNNITHFALSLIYGTLFIPGSFLCWYYPVYKAFRSDSSFNFMVFFMMFFFQFLVLIYQTLGFYGTGYTGYFSVMKLFDSSFSGILLGLLGLVIAVGFTVCAAGNFFLLTQVHKIYRKSGMSMEKAQAEWTNRFMRSPNVQRAAASAATSVFTSQAQNANRY